MSDESKWEKLPHNPRAFFELNDGFDLKDLKRGYGKWIRKYKPETHPQEFQRIRQAYEALESQLRYGVAERLVGDRNQAWTDVLHAAKTSLAANSSGRSDLSTTDTFRDATQRPRAAYRELKNRADLRPQDFWLLAALSDIVEPADPLMFLKWVLTGLQQYPDDPGLQQLCQHYLEQDLPTTSAAKVLLAMAESLPEHTFFRITENYWLRVLRSQTFEQTAKLLAQCDKLLKHGHVEPRLAFMIRFLRAAIWQADEAWIEAQTKFLNQHGSRLSPILERDFDFFNSLNRYRRALPPELPAAEKKLVAMIRDYCTLSWRDGLASVSMCFDELSRDVFGLMEAFPAIPLDRHLVLLEICQTIVEDFLDQMGQPTFTSSEKDVSRHAEAAVSDLTESASQIFERLTWKRWRMMAVPYISLIVFAIVCGSWFAPQGYGRLGTIVLFAIVQVVYFAWLKPNVLSKRWDKKVNDVLQSEYSRTWRPRLLRYVQSCHAPSSVIVRQMKAAGRNRNTRSVVNLVHSLAGSDVAIYLLTFSQNLVR